MQELLLAFPMFWILGESHFKHFEHLQYFSNFCQINKKFQNSRNLISLELIMKWIDIILEIYLLRKWFSENGIQVIFIMHFYNKFNMFIRLDPLKNLHQELFYMMGIVIVTPRIQWVGFLSINDGEKPQGFRK